MSSARNDLLSAQKRAGLDSPATIFQALIMAVSQDYRYLLTAGLASDFLSLSHTFLAGFLHLSCDFWRHFLGRILPSLLLLLGHLWFTGCTSNDH
jgi:hypothetical protein